MGNICKVTKEKNYESERQIKDYGVSGLICGETGIYVSASFNVENMQYEIYKKNAILIKISDKNKWLIKFVEHKNGYNKIKGS